MADISLVNHLETTQNFFDYCLDLIFWKVIFLKSFLKVTFAIKICNEVVPLFVPVCVEKAHDIDATLQLLKYDNFIVDFGFLFNIHVLNA